MVLSLNKLLTFGLATVTKDGRLIVDCTTIFVTNATYNGRTVRVINGAITINLPSHLQSMAPEQLCEQNIELVVDVDPARSRNDQVKAMAGLSSAFKRTATATTAIPAPVLEGTMLSFTACVATTHAPSLPEGAVIVGTRGGCTFALITINIADILFGEDGSLCLSSGLQFTFHRDIAVEAMALLQEAWARDSQEEQSVSSPSPIPSLSCISPIPLFSDGGNNTSTGIWADDAYHSSPSSPSPPSLPSSSSSPPSPVPALPRNIEANAFSGIEIALSKEEKKALEKAQKEAEKARRAEEEAQRLEQEQRQAELLKQQRLKDLADIAQKEQERREAEAKAQQQRAHRDDLVAEFNALNPVVLIAVGNPSVEQFLANPHALRDAIANVVSGTAQAGGSIEEEEAHDHALRVTVHTPHKSHIDGLRKQAGALGISIDVYQSGKHWCSVISADDMQRLKVSVRNQYIWVSAKDNGYSVQVSAESYDALMQIRPDTATLVCEARDMQEQCSHKAQRLPPTPMPFLPVFDMWGNMVAYQQMPPLVIFNPPPAYPHYA